MGLFDGVGSILPNLVGGAINAFSTGQTNIASAQALGQQENYQTQMSDTAYQRQVADMKAAGINPILSAQTGGGASTPMGGMPNLQAPQIQMPDIMGYGISMKQLDQADQKIQIDKANSASQIAKNLSDTQLNKLQTILGKQGLLGRELGADTATKFSNILGTIKDSIMSPPSPSNMPKQPASSGGQMPPINPQPSFLNGPMALP